MKKILFIFLTILSVSLFIDTSFVEAGAIKTNTRSTPQREQDTSYLTKRTNLTEDYLYKLYDEGFSREDVKSCYVIRLISEYTMDDIVDLYKSEKKDLEMILKDVQVSKEKYEEKYENTFPADDQTDHDRIKRTHVLWRTTNP